MPYTYCGVSQSLDNILKFYKIKDFSSLYLRLFHSPLCHNTFCHTKPGRGSIKLYMCRTVNRFIFLRCKKDFKVSRSYQYFGTGIKYIIYEAVSGILRGSSNEK